MPTTRHRAFAILLSAYAIVRLVAIAGMTSEPQIYAALAAQSAYSSPHPHTVCYQSSPVTNGSYWAVLYALTPSIMTAPDAPCDTILAH